MLKLLGTAHTIDQTIVGNDTVPAGTYTDIHCEEHADHDLIVKLFFIKKSLVFLDSFFYIVILQINYTNSFYFN